MSNDFIHRAIDEARKLQKTLSDNIPPGVSESAERTRAQAEDALGELQEHAKHVARDFLSKLEQKP
ncbi:MAG: hypothetical protein ABI182_01955 [Candidatus Baltobacteraceae bacterium]